MSRSPLAYPLNRGADNEVGGAADLQTDVMRFMAILSMCLLAIFALVQSIPLAPVEPAPERPPELVAKSEPVATPVPRPTPKPEPVQTMPVPLESTPEPNIILTRPKWQPKFVPEEQPLVEKPQPADPQPAPPVQETVKSDPPPVENEGFTLRFASDAALTRAVASHHVGVYAIENGRTRRMTVSESRISFWDASTPNTFHEMETGTVPIAVIDALARTGAKPDSVSWGVTLPGRMKSQLDSLMQAHQGGSLIITADGDIHWEAS